jgi:hypothetical protein
MLRIARTEARRVARELVVAGSVRPADVEPVRREDRVLKDGTSWTVSFVVVRA